MTDDVPATAATGPGARPGHDAPPHPLPGPVTSGTIARVRVLLVEDDEGDAVLVEELLSEAAPDLALDRAVTLAEAEPLARRVDCVLLDLGLPDAIDLEGIARLRRVAPRAAVIVLTGLDDEHRGTGAVAAGAQDYLVKGRVDGEVLARAVRYAIERRRAERSEQALLESQLQSQENARLERGLLPSALLRDPALRFHASYRPGRRRALLGGDFFDAVELPDSSVHLLMGDVCGHGPDEAALGVCLRIAWRALTLAGRPEEEVLDTLGRLLVHERHDEDLFVTACTVTIAPDRRAARVWLAGHPAPVLIGRDGAHPLGVRRIHLPLGLAEGESWAASEVPLDDDWSLLLYTDGLIEGRVGDTQARLGLDGLLDLLGRRVANRPDWPDGADEVLAALVTDVERLNGGELLDDLAMVLLCSGRASSS